LCGEHTFATLLRPCVSSAAWLPFSRALPGVPAVQNPALVFCADLFYSGVPGERARFFCKGFIHP
jgi:hypothetical protein